MTGDKKRGSAKDPAAAARGTAAGGAPESSPRRARDDRPKRRLGEREISARFDDVRGVGHRGQFDSVLKALRLANLHEEPED